MAGWEGIFGLILSMMMLVPAQMLTCSFDGDPDCSDKGHVNDIFLASRQASSSPVIVLHCLGFLLTSALFAGLAVTVTKMASAANRLVVDQSRIVVIWIFFLLYAGSGHETFSMAKMLGCLVILSGILLF